jgi:pantoate--beta-alanine ligase
MAGTGVRVARTRKEVREWVAAERASGVDVALVPTMGSLHAGHMSLVELARAGGASVALSIFVNPMQFGPNEDFERYPRDLERDVALASSAGVDLVFAPPVEEVYSGGEPWVAVVPERGADRLCGRTRPGHFRGVLTVVAKLFGIVRPDSAVFGQKDYQQLALIRRMTLDLDLGVRIVPAPIVREPDGLAMSSRNRYLTSEERARATVLHEALTECREIFEGGERDAAAYRRVLHRPRVEGVSIEYAEVVDPLTLESVESVDSGAVCAIAALVGSTRLIDNMILGPETIS